MRGVRALTQGRELREAWARCVWHAGTLRVHATLVRLAAADPRVPALERHRALLQADGFVASAQNMLAQAWIAGMLHRDLLGPAANHDTY